MAIPTDSVSIFAEGTFEEQILELLSYIARNKSDEERSAFVAPFQNALKAAEGRKPIEEDESRRKLVLSKLLQEVKGLGEGSDKEVEGFFNLLLAHIFALHDPISPEVKQYISFLLTVLSTSSIERLSVRYRVLSNIFNTLPRNSPLRHAVYQNLLEIAASNGDISLLQLEAASVQKWLSEWDITAAEKATFLKSISDAYLKADQPSTSYEYLLLYANSLPSTSSEAEAGAIDVIATALRLPTIFDFDPLFKLDAVVALQSHDLFGLLQIFLNNNLPEYRTWESSHPGVLEKYNIPHTGLEHKIRLLTLASLAFKHVGQSLPYSKISEALQVDASEVEKWAIDVIRAGLVWGKLSQTTRSLYITRASSRTFEQEQWQTLEKRLVAWKTGLAGILDVVANAKKQGEKAAASSSA